MMEDRGGSEQQKLKKKSMWQNGFKNTGNVQVQAQEFPGAECLYLTVGVNETVYGVLGIN